VAAGWSASARAQQTMPVIGYVSGRSLEYEERLLSSFRKGLEEEGYAAGRNIAIQYRFPTVTTAGYRRLPPISSAARWP
jgi:putative tryptophan/tyrosine transport system substrate-binding protein